MILFYGLIICLPMIILGIETSCDETAASVIETHENAPIRILSNIVSSQINIHKKYGGVVPEIAAREHVLNIVPVINEALEKAKISHKNMARHVPGLDAIAVTVGPGLITSLLVGVETAKTLSYAWEMPLIAINHIEGHIYANFVSKRKKINFPAIILTVSGGHTMLLLMEGHGKYKTISQTRDDAAGEAFDKAAQLLGLGYPGGPAISAEAEKIQDTRYKIQAITLPRPMINSPNFDFSFSGLKTALLYELKKDNDWKNKVPQYCYEFQQAIIDVLIKKTAKAAKKYNAKSIMLTGGVAANKKLREQMTKEIKKDFPNTAFLIPDLKYTTDNAVMIATAGYFKAIRKEFTFWQNLKTDPNLKL